MGAIRTQFDKDTAVVLSTEVALPSLIRNNLEEAGQRLLSRHRNRFGMAELHVHLKRTGGGLSCAAHLATDDGHYHAHAEGWDVRRLIDRAVDVLDTQVVKDYERRASLAW